MKQLNDTLLANQRDFQVQLGWVGATHVCACVPARDSCSTVSLLLSDRHGCCLPAGWHCQGAQIALAAAHVENGPPQKQAQVRLKAAEERLAATAAEKDATIADLQDQVGY